MNKLNMGQCIVKVIIGKELNGGLESVYNRWATYDVGRHSHVFVHSRISLLQCMYLIPTMSLLNDVICTFQGRI